MTQLQQEVAKLYEGAHAAERVVISLRPYSDMIMSLQSMIYSRPICDHEQ